MNTEPDVKWTFCGEQHSIRFLPLVARFEVCIEGEWVMMIAHDLMCGGCVTSVADREAT